VARAGGSANAQNAIPNVKASRQGIRRRRARVRKLSPRGAAADVPFEPTARATVDAMASRRLKPIIADQ